MSLFTKELLVAKGMIFNRRLQNKPYENTSERFYTDSLSSLHTS